MKKIIGAIIFGIAFWTAFTGPVAAQKLKAVVPATTHFARGIAKMDLEKYKLAIADFDHVIRLHPKAAIAYLNRGICFDKIGNVASALKDFTKAITFDAKLADAYIARATIYATYSIKNGRFKRLDAWTETPPEINELIFADLNKAIAIAPNRAKAYMMRADYYYRPNEDFKNVLRDYDKAVEVEPNNVDVVTNRGTFYSVVIGDAQKAFDDYSTAIRVAPKDAWGYYHRAKISLPGRSDKARLADFNTAIKLDPYMVPFYYFRSFFYRDIGEDALADIDEKHAKKLDKRDGIDAPYPRPHKNPEY